MKKSPYTILYEDDRLLVAYKEREVFSVMTEDKKTSHQNLYFYLQCYTGRKKEKVYLVHRLDYETSGIMAFAKDKETCHLLRECFEKQTVERDYEAVVREDVPENFHTVVRQRLSETSSFAVKEDENGKEAVTEISYGGKIRIGTALAIRIETGRKNQIRYALSSLGLTLIGDKRYAKDEAKRMYLNAYRLVFPSTLPLQKTAFIVPPLWLTADSDCNQEKKPIE